MRTNWTTLKQVIGAYDKYQNIFLSLINEEGKIICANANMVKRFQLKNPRNVATNILDIIHPVNIIKFKEGIQNSTDNKKPFAIELYLKNGTYHPMMWEINHLTTEKGLRKCKENNYLCVGHRILDDERINQFNKLGEKSYQYIVESMNGGVLFQDINGELISANQKAAEILNTTLERLYQLKDINQLWDGKWLIKSEAGNQVSFKESPFYKALKTGESQSDVLIIRFRNGEEKCMHFNSQPLFEENENVPFAVVSNILNITHEKKLANQLQESDAMFNAFLKQMPNMAWVVDEDAKLIFANSYFYQFFGLDEKKSLNKNIVNLVPSEVAEALYEKHLQVLETGIPAELVENTKWANGKSISFHVNIFPIDSITGKRMLGGQAVNLADKFTIEKQLREAQDRLLMLTRATSDSIWEWDLLTGQFFRNDALMDMIGYHPEETKGLSWWLRRIHPDDRNRVGDKVKNSTENKQQSWEDEYRFKCADGTYKHMRDKGYIVYESGLPVKMIGSLQDISGMKELETMLMEEKLMRQKEISETVLQVQEKERSRIGHELHDNVNQILSTAKLFIDMLSPNDEDQKEFKVKSIDYIALAIEEIRKLSKELVVPQLQNNGLSESIKNIIHDIHLTTKIKVKFSFDEENDLLTPGQRVTIFRIVQEQCKNIIKHSKAKLVTISLQFMNMETLLIINDNGIGFDHRKTRQGIGLSNIFERTRFYNGSATIESKQGKGCTLTVIIPCL